ncbi:MAG: dihydrofolate reductase [Alphaproteobacteria bacterium]|nr:dihydrofolate reductase [Alphaproteobacteria bacterium]
MTPPNPPIVLVAALARNRVIGANGDMPWHLPADLKRFKAITLGKPMVMGRKTFEAIGRPLPGRRTIVVTRDPNWRADGVEVASDLGTAITLAAETAPEEIIVAGGGQIYDQAIGLAAQLRLTWIDLDPTGDAVFPKVDPAVWQEIARTEFQVDGDRPAHAFVDYVRRSHR